MRSFRVRRSHVVVMDVLLYNDDKKGEAEETKEFQKGSRDCVT